MLERLAALPGVEGVVAQDGRDDYTRVEAHPADRVPGVEERAPFWMRTRAAPPGFFPLMGFSFVRGRDFAPGEHGGEGGAGDPQRPGPAALGRGRPGGAAAGARRRRGERGRVRGGGGGGRGARGRAGRATRGSSCRRRAASRGACWCGPAARPSR